MKNELGVQLSIIIPVYNRQDPFDLLLSELSRSILEGGFSSEVEVIVIDDYSDKATTVVDCPFTIVLQRNQKNSGAPFSRKQGFKLSKGKYIHFHDSDDSITPEWLSGIMTELKSQPDLDFLLTGREVRDNDKVVTKSQKFFHRSIQNPQNIRNWLLYQNCIGPLGGVTFSRTLLKNIHFMNFQSCQDWQMYIDAMVNAKVLRSAPDIHFIFNRGGNDRISNDARKKVMGHLQLAKVTSKLSFFKRNIRLFYLYSCKQHVHDTGGHILRFYDKNKLKITFTFLVVSFFWRLSRNGIIKKS